MNDTAPVVPIYANLELGKQSHIDDAQSKQKPFWDRRYNSLTLMIQFNLNWPIPQACQVGYIPVFSYG